MEEEESKRERGEETEIKRCLVFIVYLASLMYV